MLPSLADAPLRVEKALLDYGMPSVILFEGWDGSGKGTAISALTQRLDPRGFPPSFHSSSSHV